MSFTNIIFIHRYGVERAITHCFHCLWLFMVHRTFGSTQDFTSSKKLRTVPPRLCVTCSCQTYFFSLCYRGKHLELSVFIQLSAAVIKLCVHSHSPTLLSLDLSVLPKTVSLSLMPKWLPWKRFTVGLGSRHSAEGLCAHLVTLSTDLMRNKTSELM